MAIDSKDLLRGTLDLVGLQTLAREPMHGVARSKWIRERARGDFGLVDSGEISSSKRHAANSLMEPG